MALPLVAFLRRAAASTLSLSGARRTLSSSVDILARANSHNYIVEIMLLEAGDVVQKTADFDSTCMLRLSTDIKVGASLSAVYRRGTTAAQVAAACSNGRSSTAD
jgi:hypothetical protein